MESFKALVWREILRFLRVFKDTLIPPVISATLFLLIFGLSLGKQIQEINGVPYLHFLVPGLIMMALIDSSYANTSSSLFLSKWAFNIQEVLISPLSYMEMVVALLIGGLTRGMIVGLSVYGVSLFFVPLHFEHPLTVIFFMVFVSSIFSLLGMLVAIFAQEFEHLTIWSTFVLTPLIFLGGVFHSTTMAPQFVQVITKINPLFYMIDGLRYGVLGVSDSSIFISVSVVLFFSIVLFSWTVHLFKIGYKLRT